MDNERNGSPVLCPSVSVVSLTYNRRENIRELLTALRCQTYPSFEVIVVDNASTDGTAEMIRNDFAEVLLIEAPENLGTYSYRYGIERAAGEFVLMIDDDGLPAQRTWIEDVVSRFDQNPRLGVVACTIRMHDTGEVAHDSPQMLAQGSADEGYPCPAYNGTGVGLRASAIRTTSSFYPKHMFHSWVELHLCTQLYDHGWETRLFPSIEVYHCRPSGGVPPAHSYYGLRNYLWYVWELYPWPLVVTETLRYLGSRLKASISGRIPLGLLTRSLVHAFSGIREPLRRRSPVRPEVIRALHTMRGMSS